jgi:hypothetical protein
MATRSSTGGMSGPNRSANLPPNSSTGGMSGPARTTPVPIASSTGKLSGGNTGVPRVRQVVVQAAAPAQDQTTTTTDSTNTSGGNTTSNTSAAPVSNLSADFSKNIVDPSNSTYQQQTYDYKNTTPSPDGKKKGGEIKSYAKGGKVKSASSRADGCAIRGKTRA